MSGALLNLIINAIEAMTAGGTLCIAVNQTGDTVRLDLTDTGRGIEDEEARKIFEPFYTTKAQGLGLGMPYAKKIIDQHGGTISLSSRLGVGTTISLTLHAGQQEVNDVS
jgi:two-component system sensor histidine kinase HydH